MESGARFDNTQLFIGDARIVLGVLNHMRYQALHRVFGTSREQANVLTAVMALGAVDAAYESARRVAGLRPNVGRGDATLGLLAVREVALGVAGPSVRQVPGLGALVVFASSAPSRRRGCDRAPRRCERRSSRCVPPRSGCAASASGSARQRASAAPRARRSGARR